ncbi:hypothetical protein G4B88_020034 [Cannabis sativa]|uniref:RNase H type-1 domain-containing protein n=1 Tax=Cannabis sativa TaxID=3483 RepID=A0A7J6FDC7_CANSA|nr:hypothetical protein G4B88_020034 [Cannabis sativa]
MWLAARQERISVSLSMKQWKEDDDMRRVMDLETWRNWFCLLVGNLTAPLTWIDDRLVCLVVEKILRQKERNVWHIWNTRNSLLFQKSYNSNNVEEFEYKEAQQINCSDSSSTNPRQQQSSFTSASISSIPDNSTALFVDAALNQANCTTGLGFVFKKGPNQLKSNLIFTDCLNLVSKVNGTWKDQSALSSLVSKIRQSISNFPDASLQHLPHHFNVQAHSLAKEAIRQQEDG